MWTAILVGAAGCYLLKLAGLSVPRRVLENPRVRRVAALLPIALLTALIVIQTFSTGHGWSSTRALPGWAPPWRRSCCARRSWW
jgi:hypothetical protein